MQIQSILNKFVLKDEAIKKLIDYDYNLEQIVGESLYAYSRAVGNTLISASRGIQRGQTSRQYGRYRIIGFMETLNSSEIQVKGQSSRYYNYVAVISPATERNMTKKMKSLLDEAVEKGFFSIEDPRISPNKIKLINFNRSRLQSTFSTKSYILQLC